MKNLQPIISKHPVFKSLKKSYIQLIANFASEANFDTGEYIFHEGEKADKFFIILHGKISIEALIALEREPIIIQNIGDNDILGWAWLFPPHKWHFNARVISPTKVISLDGTVLRIKCEDDHDLGYELMKRFAGIIEQRLRSVRSQNPNMYAVHA